MYNIYALNKVLTADRSCATKFFEKNSYKILKSTSVRFFWYILQQNWSIIRDTVSLWRMFENRQIAAIEGKCLWFRNSSECLKTLCAANNWPIWTQNVSKETSKCELATSCRVLSKVFCFTWRIDCQKCVQYIRMLYPGRFILIESVSTTFIKTLWKIITLHWMLQKFGYFTNTVKQVFCFFFLWTIL